MSGSLSNQVTMNVLSMHLNKTDCQVSESGTAMIHSVCDYLSSSKPLPTQPPSLVASVRQPQWHLQEALASNLMLF